MDIKQNKIEGTPSTKANESQAGELHSLSNTLPDTLQLSYNLAPMMQSIAQINQVNDEEPNEFGRTTESKQIALSIMNAVMMGLPHTPYGDTRTESNSLFDLPPQKTEPNDEALINSLALKILSQKPKKPLS